MEEINKKYKLLHRKLFLIIPLVMFTLFLGIILAAYTVNTNNVNATGTCEAGWQIGFAHMINCHGICEVVGKEHWGDDFFVPTATAIEWANFLTNPPRHAIFTPCWQPPPTQPDPTPPARPAPAPRARPAPAPRVRPAPAPPARPAPAPRVRPAPAPQTLRPPTRPTFQVTINRTQFILESPRHWLSNLRGNIRLIASDVRHRIREFLRRR